MVGFLKQSAIERQAISLYQLGYHSVPDFIEQCQAAQRSTLQFLYEMLTFEDPESDKVVNTKLAQIVQKLI